MKKENKSNGLWKVKVETVSLNLPSPVLKKIKQTASDAGVTCQDVIKYWLAERVKQESK